MMSELIAAIRELASKVKSGSADVWDYLELVYRISAALLELRRMPVGAPTEAGQADELLAAADDLSYEVQGEALSVAQEGPLATAALLALLRMLLRSL